LSLTRYFFPCYMYQHVGGGSCGPQRQLDNSQRLHFEWKRRRSAVQKLAVK